MVIKYYSGIILPLNYYVNNGILLMKLVKKNSKNALEKSKILYIMIMTAFGYFENGKKRTHFLREMFNSVLIGEN